MKFWWPHCEAIIRATPRCTRKSTTGVSPIFPDCGHGEWFGCLHRDGTLSQRAKGNMFKGPFHLPRVLWFCARALKAGIAL